MSPKLSWSFLSVLLITLRPAFSEDFNILHYAPAGTEVDRSGRADASEALSAAFRDANRLTEKGDPACVYIPRGIYQLLTPPPAFARAGCVIGDGASQSRLVLGSSFHGDLFAWSEAWRGTTAGARVVGLSIQGSKTTKLQQNGLMFYDRNDLVYVSDVDILDLHGRGIYSGALRNSPEAYMRESRFNSLRLFNVGSSDVPAVEFTSMGGSGSDGSNEIRLNQIDIYGSSGRSLVIRNQGSGGVRNITISELRIEGKESNSSYGDLLTIGDPMFSGSVNNVTLTNTELINPSSGFAAFKVEGASEATAPYHITFFGLIGGGLPEAKGLVVNLGRTSAFNFSSLHTKGPEISIQGGCSDIFLNGYGAEASWRYNIAPTSARCIRIPATTSLSP